MFSNYRLTTSPTVISGHGISAEQYLYLTIRLTHSRDEGGYYFAQCAEIPTIATEGDTLYEVQKNVYDATRLVLSDRKPIPRFILRFIIYSQVHKGKLNLPSQYSWREVLKKLKRVGFVPVRQTGSHIILKNSNGRTVVVPKHNNPIHQTYNPIHHGTLVNGVLSQAGLSFLQFESL